MFYLDTHILCVSRIYGSSMARETSSGTEVFRLIDRDYTCACAMNSQWDSVSEFEFYNGQISLAIYCTCATHSYGVAVNQPENLSKPILIKVCACANENSSHETMDCVHLVLAYGHSTGKNLNSYLF